MAIPDGSEGDFLAKAEVSLRGLFAQARAANELQFAFSLSPEFRGPRAELHQD